VCNEPRTKKDGITWGDGWELIRELGIHVVVGTALFVTITVSAVALDFLVIYLKGEGVTSLITVTLELCSYFLFFIGVLLFLVFVLRIAWRSIRKS
jgi:hypothetical protein